MTTNKAKDDGRFRERLTALFSITGGDQYVGAHIRRYEPSCSLAIGYEYLSIDEHSAIIQELEQKLAVAVEYLELISVRKEGFEEDNYRCIELADIALERIKQTWQQKQKENGE